jgi:hypothetical protein
MPAAYDRSGQPGPWPAALLRGGRRSQRRLLGERVDAEPLCVREDDVLLLTRTIQSMTN